MIIWLASYPKSGNTWVRSFLTNYFSGSSEFNFTQLDKIRRFPTPELMDQLKINIHNLSEIASNWINMQEFINLKNDTTYLKTHNAMCTVNNYSFTNKKNTIGFIYLVRDPRDVILSYSHHLEKSIEFTLKIMIDKSAREKMDNKGNDESILGSWSENYKSWRDYNSVKKIIIKYEDLIQNPYETFFKIINYLNGINGLPIDEGMIKKSIENTSFKNLQNLEKKYGFPEKDHGVFFRKGKSKEWKNDLDKKIIFKIEQAFNEEMKELGYL